jgi:hypothetical protein
MSLQITDSLIMVRPRHFGFNPETASSNAFQSDDQSRSAEDIRLAAIREFDEFVSKLRSAGINVHVMDDDDTPPKPDAVFPNNWVSFHHDGTVVTYPMHATIRRAERREALIEQIGQQFQLSKRIHLEASETESRFLEGTGSIIFDHDFRLAYACLSPRTSLGLLRDLCRHLGYEALAFRATDANHQEIYHTNVMMAIGVTFVIICLDAVQDPAEKQMLLARFHGSQKEVINISLDQMNAFAGNMLQVKSRSGERYLIMSEQAYRSLRPEQISQIEQHSHILHSPLYTIEQYGGGSARCMLAEIFCPQRP